MIYDCFLYNGEQDQLTMRVEELRSLDDVMHVMVMGTRTFQGDRIESASATFTDSGMAERARLVLVDDWSPKTMLSPWFMEAHQRDAILRGIEDANAFDHVLVSDADEIPRASVVADLCDFPGVPPGEVIALRMPYYYFALDWLVPWEHSLWPVLSNVATMRRITPQYARYHPSRHIDDAGWHFTHQGGPDAVFAKFRSFAHTEFAGVTRDQLADCIANGKDYDGRGDLIPVEVDDTYPRCVYENPDRWKHMLRRNLS